LSCTPEFQTGNGCVAAEAKGARGLDLALGWFFGLFNKGFGAATNAYASAVRHLLRLAAVVLLVYAGLLVLTVLGFKTGAGRVRPDAGPGLPDRPGPVTRRRHPATLGRDAPANGSASIVPGVSHTVEFTGFSGLDGTNRPPIFRHLIVRIF
jgi:hypothetical protein